MLKKAPRLNGSTDCSDAILEFKGSSRASWDLQVHARIAVHLYGKPVNGLHLARWSNPARSPDDFEIPPWLRGEPQTEKPLRGKLRSSRRHTSAWVEFRKMEVRRLDTAVAQ